MKHLDIALKALKSSGALRFSQHQLLLSVRGAQGSRHSKPFPGHGTMSQDPTHCEVSVEGLARARHVVQGWAQRGREHACLLRLYPHSGTCTCRALHLAGPRVDPTTARHTSSVENTGRKTRRSGLSSPYCQPWEGWTGDFCLDIGRSWFFKPTRP